MASNTLTDHSRPPLVLFALLLSLPALSQPPSLGTRFARPLSQVVAELASRFHTRLRCPNAADTAGLTLTYADARLRPYSLEESLRNVLSPFDLQALPQPNGSWRIAPYHYPRRTPEEGRKMLLYLQSLYPTRAEWEARRDSLRRDVTERLALPEPLHATAQLGEERKHDGYRTRNFRLPVANGASVQGTLYYKENRRPSALIVLPSGHFAGGRRHADLQRRYATLARMGALCVSYDQWGEGESASHAHATDTAHRMQTAAGLALIDWALRRLPVDPARVGVCGFSGGGSQTVLLGLLEPRVTALCPVVSLAAWFDGGCPCESGIDIHRAAGGTCNPELLATFAPGPVHVVSDAGDWTRTVPEQEMPYLRHVWQLYGAADKVGNTHLPNDRHDAGPNKRQAVYQFFAETFGLDPGAIDESRVDIEDDRTLTFQP